MTAGGLIPSQTYKDLAARADNTAVQNSTTVVVIIYDNTFHPIFTPDPCDDSRGLAVL